MSSNECNGCGAPRSADSLATHWTCAYCKATTYSQAYLQSQVSDVDLSKTSHLLEVGLVAYQAGEFDRARDLLQRSLAEDSGNADAWMYTALSIAAQADIATFYDSADKVRTYSARAQELSPTAPRVIAGRSVCANDLAAVGLRAAQRELRDAEKTWFSFSSSDPKEATRRTNREVESGLRFVSESLALRPDDIRVAGGLASTARSLAALYKGQVPAALMRQCESILEDVRRQNPSLHSVLVSESHSRKSIGCLTLVSIGLISALTAL